VSNAIRYTASGGIIVGCRRQGDAVSLEVIDSGAGIPEDQREHIFDEFVQLGGPDHDRQRGLGLGLAIVDRLCRLLGHPLTLTSAVGRGSRFAVRLPRAQAAVTATLPAAQTMDHSATLAAARVVVIDDDPLVLDAVGNLLRSWGCTAIAAPSAAEALAALAARPEPPDLIISDFHLADGGDGIAAIERLREKFRQPIPAVVVSADISPERQQQVREKGYTLLHKPVRPMALRATVTHALKKSAVTV